MRGTSSETGPESHHNVPIKSSFLPYPLRRELFPLGVASRTVPAHESVERLPALVPSVVSWILFASREARSRMKACAIAASRRRVLALGDLDPEQAPALRALNTLRNDFAHDVSTRLSTERVDAIWGALGQRERAVVESIYRGERRCVTRRGTSRRRDTRTRAAGRRASPLSPLPALRRTTRRPRPRSTRGTGPCSP